METASLQIFLQNPADTTSFAGSPVTLTCQINWGAFDSSSHQVMVAWKKDGILLLNSSSVAPSQLYSASSSSYSQGITITGDPSVGMYDLSFQAPPVESSGSYTCEIYMHVSLQVPEEHEYHNVTVFVGATRPATLTLLPDVTPVCSFIAPSGSIFQDGTPVSFLCTTYNMGTFQLGWKVNGDAIENDTDDDEEEEEEESEEEEYEQVGGDFYNLNLFYNTTVGSLDRGDILECEMSSTEYPTLTRTCKLPALNIQYSPRVSIRTVANVPDVNVGDDVRFLCDVDANPLEEQVEWTVMPPQNIAFHGHEIDIYEASSSNNLINLTCKASNKIGESSTYYVVHLKPVYKPQIFISLVRNVPTTHADEGVRLRCNVVANPTAVTVHWVVVPRSLVHTKMEAGYEVVLSSLSREPLHVDVSCLAINRVGSAIAHISIYLPPRLQATTPVPIPQITLPINTATEIGESNTTNATPTAPLLIHVQHESHVTTPPPTRMPLTTPPQNPQTVTNWTSPIQNMTTFYPFGDHPNSSPQQTSHVETNRTTSSSEKTTPAVTENTPLITVSAGRNRRHLIIGCVAAGGVVLLATLIGIALVFSRLKINKALRANRTRVMYHNDDESLVLPFGQNQLTQTSPTEDNLYEYPPRELQSLQDRPAWPGWPGLPQNVAVSPSAPPLQQDTEL